MNISPISFKSGIIKVEDLRFNPDTIQCYRPHGDGKFSTRIRFINGEAKDIYSDTDVFDKAMTKAKNSDEIVDITDEVHRCYEAKSEIRNWYF